MLRIIDSDNRRAVDSLLHRATQVDRALDSRVRRIVDGVRRGGDDALSRFARRFDGVTGAIEMTAGEIASGAAQTPRELRHAIAIAARNIARVAFRQIPRHFDLQVAPGVTVEQRVEPIARVGCYVPGGRFPLSSSLLMTVVPARVAGVAEVIVVCPRPEPVVLAAAAEAGVTRLFRVGGAHAIAALAYGTKTIPRVTKIVGPGNRFVAAAKRIVSGERADCSIDFHAGPTEIVLVAASMNPEWAAADLIAQAEHDPEARSVLITWQRSFARRVAKAVERRSRDRSVVRRSLRHNGAIVVAASADEAIELSNRIAPEHLVLDDERLTRRPLVAGTVFVGPFTAQAAGDYATGSNHVLPTAAAARVRGGLSAADFVRVMSVQRLTHEGLRQLAPTVTALARAEGLEGHAESIEVRLA
jgi:histidinol dehydrogenase